MKAARFHAREDVRIDDIPEPETTEGAVEIKVDWCGICGTDLHEYLEGPILTPVAGVTPTRSRVRSPRSSSVTSSPDTSPRSARG
jgi:(R,R)-butanediol dehydrogenase/meso-butanediol dehydrogenase/diacetyl reductase